MTLRHLLVAVLVVIVVNAQLTWWVIFVLRENRHRLDLERTATMARCESRALTIRSELVEAEHHLARALLMGLEPGQDPPPKPFSSWRFATDCGATRVRGETLTLSSPSGSGQRCVEAELAAHRTAALLAAPAGMEIVAAPADDSSAARPAVTLGQTLNELSIRPTEQTWSSLLEGYRRRIIMMVSEGSFFALMLFVLVALLWRTLRRETALEQQHRNFLSAITHELKSPLAAMRLSLETVLRGRADSTASVRFLENALQDTERLQNLVEKVLEVTRYAHVGGGISAQETNISEVVEVAIDRFSRRTTAAGVDLRADIEPDVWGSVDAEALSIAISNLLENALKYGGTPPRIEVRFRLKGTSATIEVEDNGRGISESDVPLVFDRFWRSGDEMTRTTDGTGLGLFLVKQIVEGHRGTVRISKTGPTGSTFRVILAAYDAGEGP